MPTDTAPDPLHDAYFNRDLSWLEFNRRVLHEASDDRTPLLERVRFIQIFSTNLDEFFMKRVGFLKHLAASRQAKPTRDGLLPTQQLKLIRPVVDELLSEQARCWKRQIDPALRASGVELLKWSDLTDAERAEAEEYFRLKVFPILTPLAVDPGHPFPFISNLSLSLGVILQHKDRDDILFARIKVPEVLPLWIGLGGATESSTHRFFSLVDLIVNNLDDLFLDMRILDVNVFRVTRSVEPEVEEAVAEDDEDDEIEDLRELVQEELRLRRFAPVVRLEHDKPLHPELRQFLMEELQLGSDDLLEVPMGLLHTDLRAVHNLKLPKLSFPPWTPCVPVPLAEEKTDIFSVIRSGDILVHHPYESFNASVERFVSAAVADPNVLAIKMTLYRTDDQSPFIRMLIAAAEARKQVVCLVELKARFDEERNIQLTHALEKSGVHVVYGVVGLKTHTKMTLVVRQEPEGIRCYSHIGTGNYHTQTARLYTDLGLFTCDPDINGDIVELFHHLTGRSIKKDYRKLLVAPANMRQRFMELIDREIANARDGRPAHIIAKLNSLEDRKIIAKLYEASQAGVEIDLIVRGFCCLKPGVPGVSERIRVISIIGRFLEHARVFYFRNGAQQPAQGEFFIGSADWMYRNLLNRVEVVVPLASIATRERCLEMLQIQLDDQRQAWELHSDGSYHQRSPRSPDELGSQQTLMEQTRIRCPVKI